MTILKERQVWKRTKPEPTKICKTKLGVLSDEQEEGVRRALGALKVRYGSLNALARAIRVDATYLNLMFNGRRKVHPGLAIQVAPLAGVTVDDILSGAFPKPGACPMCGRIG